MCYRDVSEARSGLDVKRLALTWDGLERRCFRHSLLSSTLQMDPLLKFSIREWASKNVNKQAKYASFAARRLWLFECAA